MSSNDKPIANQSVVYRDDLDPWAVLFDPDTGDSFGLNPVGVFVWKRLDGKHTIKDIVSELQGNCEDIAAEAEVHVKEFIDDMVQRGLAGYEE